MIDPVALAQALIAIPSVTPASGAVFDVLEAALTPLGFAVHRFIGGDNPGGPVENLVAVRGSGAPHFGFARPYKVFYCTLYFFAHFAKFFAFLQSFLLFHKVFCFFAIF